MDRTPGDRSPSGASMRRPRRWRSYSITGIAGLTLLAGQCAPAQQCAPSPPAVAPAGALQQVVDITNAERGKVGLPALVVDQRLMNAAQGHSADQAALDRMSHTGSDGSDAGVRIRRQGYDWRAWGENVAAGYPDAPSVMRAWMASAGHRANIQSGAFTQIGVGLAYAADGSAYWTQVFAAPR